MYKKNVNIIQNCDFLLKECEGLFNKNITEFIMFETGAIIVFQNL